MRINRRQKIKLAAGLLLTLYVLFVMPRMGMELTTGSKAALIAGVWLAAGAAFWYRRDRF